MLENNIDENKNSKNPQLWIKRNVIIQAIIGVLLLGTFILTLTNTVQQRKFSRDTLRPFISYTIKGNLDDEGDLIKINSLIIENSGRTPAYNVKAYNIISINKDYPINKFRELINSDTTLYGVLIPKDQKIYKEIKTYIYDQNNEKIDIIEKNEILENKSIYYHIYIKYEDLSNHRYYLRSISKVLTPYGKIGYCEGLMIYASDEPL